MKEIKFYFVGKGDESFKVTHINFHKKIKHCTLCRREDKLTRRGQLDTEERGDFHLINGSNRKVSKRLERDTIGVWVRDIKGSKSS